jgi:hypothetical protein
MNDATTKQIEYIQSLKSQRVKTEQVAEALEVARSLWEIERFSKKAASIVIEVLMDAPVQQDRPTPEGATKTWDSQGMHQLEGAIYKVQLSQNGRLYAKLLVRQAGGGWHFEYAPGAVYKLSEETKMDLEQGKQFGALYGTCCVCGRTLTNEDSIEAGIGPICAEKF